MANDGSPRGRAGRGNRRCCTLTRVDLLTFLLAATLCSASYCLGIWHNSRGAADSRILGPSAGVVFAGAASCRGDARADVDEPLVFEAHHAAESAGLSVSSSTTPSARRALRGAAPGSTGHRGTFLWLASRGVAWAGTLARGAAVAAAGESWAGRTDAGAALG